MVNKLDFDALASDILQVLQRHGLNPDMYGVTLRMGKDEFERIAVENPEHHAGIIGITTPRWFVQIMRRRDLEDYPPGAIMPPPPDG